MLAVDPDNPPRRDKRTCASCEATPSACRSRHWLGGRYCCEECSGDHDQEVER